MKIPLKIKNSRLKIPRCKILNLKSLIKDNKGMTLLEIAISMAILAIALVALANLFPIGLRASRRAVNYSSASILAQRVIENIKRSASIDDAADGGVSGNLSNGNSIGYFELANDGTGVGSEHFPFADDDLFYDLGPNKGTRYIGPDADGYSIYRFQYYEDKVNKIVMDMWADVKSVDWNANGNTIVGREKAPTTIDLDDVLLSQKVYVAVYWTEADRERADTFITYISNPFYEKYR